MKRIFSTDEVSEAKRRFEASLAKAKAETAKAQEDFNGASARLAKAKEAQARLEGAIEALGRFK